MKKTITIDSKSITALSLTITLLLISFGTKAEDLSNALIRCSEYQEDGARLACFDRLTKKLIAAKASGESVKELTTEPKITMDKSQKAIVSTKAPLVHQPKTSTHSQSEGSESDSGARNNLKSVTTTVTTAEDFGKEIVYEIESIQSRIISNFTGWKKGMKFTLENGQVWKVKSSRSSYKPMDNPVVTITKGAMSSFNAKVEGLNTVVKVKRIK